jgi:RND superfamily putative drug exporter
MVSVFASFLLTSDPLVKMFGLGLAAAIAIAATIVLCLLGPAR